MLALGLVVTLALQTAPVDGDAPSLGSGLRAARLLAQAPSLPAPPLAQAPDEAPRVRRRLLDVSSELRRLDTNWPASSIVLVAVGASTAPLVLPGVYLVVMGGFAQGLGMGVGAAAGTAFLIGGAITLAVGVVGVIMCVVGIVQGVRASEQAKETRERLLGERAELEERLRQLEPPRPTPVPVGPTTGREPAGPALALVVASF